VLPELIKTHENKIIAWSAGCASGEEAYSFMILWNELKAARTSLPKLEMLATDMSPAYLERARAGRYPASSLKEIPEDLLDVYFNAVESNEYVVIDLLRERILWEKRDLTAHQPEQPFQLIFLRNNLLTYYKDPIKTPVFSHVTDSLSKGGFAVIGSHERRPFESGDLSPIEALPYVFKKQG